MPKEYITRPIPQELPEPGPDGVVTLTADDGIYVSMHWSNGMSGRSDGEIQIALTADVEVLREVVANYDQGLRYSDTMHDGQVMLFSDGLTRDAVQRLIRTARRARDNSYGRDE